MSIAHARPTTPPPARRSLSGQGFVAGPTLVQRFSIAFGLSGPQVGLILECLRLGLELPRRSETFRDVLAARLDSPLWRIDGLMSDMAPDLIDRAARDALGAVAPFLDRLKAQSRAWYGPYAVQEPIRAERSEDVAPALVARRPDFVIVTGFLGSGKTTLVNALLRAPAMAASLVVVNEIGAAAVDHLVVQALSSPQDLFLMRDGCLCCAFGSGLADTIRFAVDRRDAGRGPYFDRLIVETSGLADPIAVVHRLEQDRKLREIVAYRGVCTTVDVCAIERDGLAAPEAARQIDAADWIVATKTDLIDPEALPRTLARLRARNPAARLFVDRGRSIAQELALAMLEDFSAGATGARWTRSVGAASRQATHDGATRVATIRRGEIDEVVARLFLDLLAMAKGDELYRVKGVLALRDQPKPLLVQAVRANFHELLRLDQPADETNLTIIAPNLDRRAVERLLALLER